MLLLHLLFQALYDLTRSLDTDISHNQDLFQFLVEILINGGKSAEYRIKAVYNILSGLGQTCF